MKWLKKAFGKGTFGRKAAIWLAACVAIGWFARQIIASVAASTDGIWVFAGPLLGIVTAVALWIWGRKDAPIPTRSTVWKAEGAVAAGSLAAVAGTPTGWGTDGAYGLAALAVGLIVAPVFVAGVFHSRWQPTATQFGRLLDAARHTRKVERFAILVAGVVVAAVLAFFGIPGPLATTLGLVVAALPALRHLAIARMQQAEALWIRTSLADLWHDKATGWPADPERADGPIWIEFDGVQATRVGLRLKSGFEPEGERKAEAAIAARLSARGLWTVRFDHGNRLAVITPKALPEFVAYPNPDPNRPWHEFPLGVYEDGTEAKWDLLSGPHALICGPTGSGKSVVQRNIVFGALTHPEWRILGIDLKMVELSWMRKYDRVIRIATDLHDAVAILDGLAEECQRRYAEMDAAGVNHFKALPDPFPPILLMIDEMANLMAPEGVKTDEGKERDELHGRATARVAYLARTSRACGIFLALATQRPDAKILGGGELKSNLDFRVAAGRMDSTPSLMVLDSDAAKDLPKIKGRGIIRNGGEMDVYQGYFAEQSWYDEWLAGGQQGPADEPDSSFEVPGPATEISTHERPGRTNDPQYAPVVADEAAAEFHPVVPTLTFAAVGGYEDVKRELRSTVARAFDSATAAEYGIEVGGVLLYGPPGTGKTHLAEALAGTLGVKFLKVSVADLTGAHWGDNASKVRSAISAAVAAAPCIVLIDEIDAIAGRRDAGMQTYELQGVNALLVELDRARQTPGVVVMATTNDPERLDPAVIRDGRMSKRIRIDHPDLDARVGILRSILADRPRARGVDAERIAEQTQGYTAASLKEFIDAGAGTASDEGRDVTTEDVLAAVAARGGQDRPTVEHGGLDSLVLPEATRAEIDLLISLIKEPEQAAQFGQAAPTGLVLYGPPGTGKTSIAKALAATAQMSFYAVKPDELTTSAYGGSSDAVRRLFERARENAPSIIFFDEIEGIAGKRGGFNNAHADTTLRALLAEMDGIGSTAAGGRPVFVIGATNRVQDLDPAIVRGGRLSQSIEIGLPDEAARLELLRRATASMTVAPDVSLEGVAAQTFDLAPADLNEVVARAGRAALRARRGDGLVHGEDFESALDITERPTVAQPDRLQDGPEFDLPSETPEDSGVEREGEPVGMAAGDPDAAALSGDDYLSLFGGR